MYWRCDGSLNATPFLTLCTPEQWEKLRIPKGLLGADGSIFLFSRRSACRASLGQGQWDDNSNLDAWTTCLVPFTEVPRAFYPSLRRDVCAKVIPLASRVLSGGRMGRPRLPARWRRYRDELPEPHNDFWFSHGDPGGGIGVTVLRLTPGPGQVLTLHDQHHWVTTQGDTILAPPADATVTPAARPDCTPLPMPTESSSAAEPEGSNMPRARCSRGVQSTPARLKWYSAMRAPSALPIRMSTDE